MRHELHGRISGKDKDIHVSHETPQDQIRMPRPPRRSTQPGPHAIRDSI
jgi:hypothetical protein